MKKIKIALTIILIINLTTYNNVISMYKDFINIDITHSHLELPNEIWAMIFKFIFTDSKNRYRFDRKFHKEFLKNLTLVNKLFFCLSKSTYKILKKDTNKTKNKDLLEKYQDFYEFRKLTNQCKINDQMVNLLNKDIISYEEMQQIINLVLDGADINIRCKYNKTALIIVVEYGYIEMVNILINNGANIDLKDENNDTALIKALRYNNPKMARILISYAPNTNIQGYCQETALMIAIEEGYEDIASLLIELGTELDLKDKEGNTALIKALMNNQWNIVNLLVKSNADVNIENNYGETAITIAKKLGLIFPLKHY